MKTFCKTVAWLLILLLLGGVVAFIWVRTDGGNEDFKTFELKHNGETIVQATSTAEFAADSVERYDVGYLFDTSKETREYSVKIVANANENFTYKAGETSYSWKNTKDDFSSYFGLVKYSDHFVFQIPASYSIENALKGMYGRVTDVTATRGAPIFALVVSSYNEKVTYRIHFSVKVPEVDESSTYRISHEVVGGTDGQIMFSCPETAHYGEVVTFTLQTPADYQLVGVSLRRSGGTEETITAEGNPYSHTYSFIMPNEDVTLVITITNVTVPSEPEKNTYQISHEVVGGTDDNILISCPGTAKEGDPVTFTVQPIASYTVESIVMRVSGSGDTAVQRVGGESSYEYSFIMPAAAVTIVITVAGPSVPPDPEKSDVYAISIEQVGGESVPVSIDCPETAKAGETVTFTVQPNTPYTVESIVLRVAGSEDQYVQQVGGVYSHEYSFTMPASAVTIVITLFNPFE